MTDVTRNFTLNDLKEALNAIVEGEYAMTQANYYKLLGIKNDLKGLFNQEDISPVAIGRVLMITYEHLNKMEEYYENHDHKWLKD